MVCVEVVVSAVNFNVSEFPKFVEEFHRQGATNWITFFHDMGYKIDWQHYAKAKKYVEMDEAEFMWFKLRWSE